MADEALNQQVQKSMLDKFKQAEHKKFSKGTKEMYLGVAKEFEGRKIVVNVARPREERRPGGGGFNRGGGGGGFRDDRRSY